MGNHKINGQPSSCRRATDPFPISQPLVQNCQPLRRKTRSIDSILDLITNTQESMIQQDWKARSPHISVASSRYAPRVGSIDTGVLQKISQDGKDCAEIDDIHLGIDPFVIEDKPERELPQINGLARRLVRKAGQFFGPKKQEGSVIGCDPSAATRTPKPSGEGSRRPHVQSACGFMRSESLPAPSPQRDLDRGDYLEYSSDGEPEIDCSFKFILTTIAETWNNGTDHDNETEINQTPQADFIGSPTTETITIHF
jgi:hypothetical protein